MHEHPNQFGDVTHQSHFTLPPPIMGEIPSSAVPALPKFSPDEIFASLDEKNEGLLDACVLAASLAVDEARAGLTVALAYTDGGLIDHAARAYKQAALLHFQAQQERYCRRVSTPPHALTFSGDGAMTESIEVRGDLR